MGLLLNVQENGRELKFAVYTGPERLGLRLLTLTPLRQTSNQKSY